MITMDEDTQEALIIRLNSILFNLEIGKSLSAAEEIKELKEDVKSGIVAPF